MGKVDDLRALREARFKRLSELAKISQELQDLRKDTRSALRSAADRAGNRKEVDALLAQELCGHKAIGGKTCTRPIDHPEKNHRYK